MLKNACNEKARLITPHSTSPEVRKWRKRKTIAALVMLLVASTVLTIVVVHTNEDKKTTPKSDTIKTPQIVSVDWVHELVNWKHGQAPPPTDFPYEKSRKIIIYETQWHDTAYSTGHIPHSIHSDSNQYETGYPNYFLVSKDELRKRGAAMGLQTKDCTYVVYSDDAIFSSRLWFVLTYLGVEDVRVMNGSFSIWVDKGFPVETTPYSPEPNPDFTPFFNDNILLTLDDVLRWYTDTTAVSLIDVRTEDEFEGVTSGYPNLTAVGRIPHSTWGGDAVQGEYTTSTGLLFPDVVMSRWENKSVPLSRPLYFYCGNGYRASLALLFAALLGKPAGLYSSGWYEWSTTWVENSSYNEPPTPGWIQEPSGRPILP